jgi:hypothetical protein
MNAPSQDRSSASSVHPVGPTYSSLNPDRVDRTKLLEKILSLVDYEEGEDAVPTLQPQ